MSYYIQSYGKGYIQRNGDKYELVEDGKLVGSYQSIETLVKYHPLASADDTPATETKKSAKK